MMAKPRKKRPTTEGEHLSDWMATGARVLWEAPLVNEEPTRTNGLRFRVEAAYRAGFKAGRAVEPGGK